MVRTRIQLDEVTYNAIKQIALKGGKSVSDVVLELLHKALEQPPWKPGKLTLADFSWVGKYSSGKSNISEEHDEYLAKDFGHQAL